MRNIDAVRKYAKALGITISLASEDTLGGSGGLYIAPDTIYVDKDMGEDLLVLGALHELGHAISEKNDEVTKIQHKIYDEAYPEDILTKDMDEKDKEVIRYIEARAMMYANRLIEELKIDIKREVIERDNLYTVLSLEIILTNGILTPEDIDELDLQCKLLVRQGSNWKEYYAKYLK